MADPNAMAHATQRANARHNTGGLDRASAYYYGNVGDSIERRQPDAFGLGGGSDAGTGAGGAGGSYPAAGNGLYYGAGMGYGVYDRNYQVGGGTGNVGGFQYLRRYAGSAAFNHNIMAQCMMAYYGYGIVRNVIDTYANFACEGLEVDHADKSVRNFYKNWFKKVGMKERAHKIFTNLFVTSNVFVQRRWATLDAGDKRAMKETKASEILHGDVFVVKGDKVDRTIDPGGSAIDQFFQSDKSMPEEVYAASKPAVDEERLPKRTDSKIPWGYTCLNPLQMERRGKKIRLKDYWVMTLSKEDTVDIAKGMGMSYNRSRHELGDTEVNLPAEFQRRIKKYEGGGAGYYAEVRLNDNDLAVIQDPGKFDWTDWAVPAIFPALRALSFKDCLRAMEIKACNSIINSIYLFKLGDIEKGMPAEEEHFERLADMLQSPGQTMNVIWNEAIEAEVVQADVTSILDPKKHESADRDILTALGVPEVLLGGKGGNFSNSFIGVAAVLERLESARDVVRQWIMGEMKLVADAMKFKKLPSVKFGKTSLRDQKAEQTFMMNLADRNVISNDSLLREAGLDAEIEVAKKKEEKPLTKKGGVMEPQGPFVKDDAPKPGAPGVPGAKPPGGAAPKAKPKTPNGRPAGTSTGPNGKQNNPRGPKGQGVAEILAMYDETRAAARTMLDQIEGIIGESILQARGLRYIKQFPREERDRLEQLCYNVFSHMPPAPEPSYNDDFVVNMLQSDAVVNVKADVLDLYTNQVAEYSSKFGKQPSRETRRQFMVSAWTQFAIHTHLDNLSS
jgi:hypothetical protein